MATLTANISADQTLIPVSEQVENGHYTIDDEAIYVHGHGAPKPVGDLTRDLNVDRGHAGTTAVSHLSAATLTRYYPDAASADGGGLSNPITEPLVIDLTAGAIDATGFEMNLSEDWDFTVPMFKVTGAGATFLEVDANGELSTGGNHMNMGGGRIDDVGSIWTQNVVGVVIQESAPPNDVKVRLGTVLGVAISVQTAPADISISIGEACIWFDATNGAAKLMVKAKTLDGTVVSGEVALT